MLEERLFSRRTECTVVGIRKFFLQIEDACSYTGNALGKQLGLVGVQVFCQGIRIDVEQHRAVVQ